MSQFPLEELDEYISPTSHNPLSSPAWLSQQPRDLGHFWSPNPSNTQLNSSTANPLHPMLPKGVLGQPLPQIPLNGCKQDTVKQSPFSHQQSQEASGHNLALNFCLPDTVFTITAQEIWVPKGLQVLRRVDLSPSLLPQP